MHTHIHTHAHTVRKVFSEKLTSNLETKLGVSSRKIQKRRKDELKKKKENYVLSPKGKKNYKINYSIEYRRYTMTPLLREKVKRN